MKKFARRLRYGGIRFMRKFRRGEKGFTLMELLIVFGILGVLAAVLVPRLSTFFSTGQMAAANQEVANVETSALAFYADNNGTWPADSDALVGTYISAAPKHAVYSFDTDGRVSLVDGTDSLIDANVEWNVAEHEWVKVVAAP